jgi:hypothetical protein
MFLIRKANPAAEECSMVGQKNYDPINAAMNVILLKNKMIPLP